MKFVTSSVEIADGPNLTILDLSIRNYTLSLKHEIFIHI